jgi:hypothetical protein
MIRHLLVLSVFVLTLTGNGIAQNANGNGRSEIAREQTKWIEGVLRSIEAVKVGMTRSELLKVFTGEGGLSTTSQRTYVYRQCPYIKVDVKFASDSPAQELPTDRIVEISRPYLAWSVAD